MRKLHGKLISVIGTFSFIGIAVLTAVIIILASGQVSRMIDERLFTIAEQNSEKMKSLLEEYMSVSRTMSHIMEGYKDMPPAERRRAFDSMLKQVTAAQGLHYAANLFETYAATLKRFAATADKGVALIRESLAAGDWKPYTVQVHAYKGLCASIGAVTLSEWGKKLEAASKGEDKAVCLEETESFCFALENFSAALRRTSLFTEESASGKTEVGVDVIASRLAELIDACDEGRVARIKAAAKDMKSLRLAGAPPDFESDLEKILDLVWSMDYDDVVEKARELYVRLENMNGTAVQ
jgi:HPt (histidine-containing phosphotransfer) domain-containing protein